MRLTPSPRRMRHLRHLQSSRGRQPDLSRALCPAASRPGELRHRLLRRQSACTPTSAWGWWPMSSATRRSSRRCRANRPSAMCATRPPGPRSRRMSSRSWSTTPAAPLPSPTTATWSMPSCSRPNWRPTGPSSRPPWIRRSSSTCWRSPAPTRSWTGIVEALNRIKGAYCLLFLTESRMIAVRDPHGFRPLCLGKLGDA